MIFWMLILAGALRVFATLQYRPGPRSVFNWGCVAALGYGGYVLVYEPDRAWRIRWAWQAVADMAFRLLNAVVP